MIERRLILLLRRGPRRAYVRTRRAQHVERFRWLISHSSSSGLAALLRAWACRSGCFDADTRRRVRCRSPKPRRRRWPSAVRSTRSGPSSCPDRRGRLSADTAADARGRAEHRRTSRARDGILAACRCAHPSQLDRATRAEVRAQARSGPRPSTVSNSRPDIPLETLEQHLREGLQAIEQVLDALDGDAPPMHALVNGPEQLWRGHLEVLSLVGARVVDTLLWPRLRDPETSER